MTISVRKLCFGYAGKPVFDNLSAELDGGPEGRPLVILGPSGCGKTTLLKLLSGLLKPLSGEIVPKCQILEQLPIKTAVLQAIGRKTARACDKITDFGTGSAPFDIPPTSCIFQEPRLLPWLTVLKNVSLPLEKELGEREARARARHFLSLVSLGGKEDAYPRRLSGGEAQRVSMARAFAWPAPALFMDEPFQSLDIPLRISLMDLTLSLLARDDYAGKRRFLITVTHDPREAAYMGGRIIILGKAGGGIAFDRVIDIPEGNRAWGSAAELEREMIGYLR